jgi:hypothetical protein
MKFTFRAFACILATLLSILSGCSSDPLAEFHMEKRFWTPEDYSAAMSLIQFHTTPGQKMAGYSSPDRKAVFAKLMDVNNFKVVLDDTVLGLKHRGEFSVQMFQSYKDMHTMYSVLDNQDKYIYPQELVDITDFGMQLQIYYFKLAIDKLRKDADDPKDPEILNLIRLNSQAIVDNFTMNLEIANKESAFTAEAMSKFASSVDVNFKRLLEVFPSANYSDMLGKSKLMLEKTKTKELKEVLTKLVATLEAKMKPSEPAPVTQS